MSSRVDKRPVGAGDAGSTQHRGACHDAHHVARGERRAKGAAEAQLGVVGAAT